MQVCSIVQVRSEVLVRCALWTRLPTVLRGRFSARRLRSSAFVVGVALVTLAGSIPSAAAGAMADGLDHNSVLAVGDGGFSDVSEGGVHSGAVDSLAAEGVFEGTECAPGEFCPGEPLLRWVMAVWLVRVLDGADPLSVGSSRFADVDASVWWAPFVERLAVLGVTKGCASGPLRFCPDEAVTRAQMASFLTRAFRLEAVAGPAGFVDVGGNAHFDDINALASAGITKGCATGPLRFCPDQAVTRAEMASFLNRARGGGSAAGPLEVVDYQRINEMLSSLGALDQTEGCAPTRVPASVEDHIEVMRIEDGCVLIEYEPLAGQSVAEARRVLASDPTVVAADLPVVDFDLSHDYSEKDPDAGLQWHLPQVDAKALWDGWPDDAEVTVAVIDSGVDATHGDLQPNVVGAGLGCHRRDYSGHGTHVAGIAGAVAENGIAVAGIAPDARILSIKLPLNNVPPDPDCEQDISSLAQAIKVAVESGADVINMSLGAVWYWEFPTTLAAAIHLATTSGVVLVAAAGNRGESFANRNAPEIPAIHSDVIAVAAATESLERAGFSTSNRWVNVAAPGNIIYSTVPCDRDDCGTGIKSGTSMATPVVSGLVAHMKARYPDAAPAEIRKAIYDTARQPGSNRSRARTDDFGWGIIQPLAAIEALAEMVGDTNAAPQFTSSPNLSAAENTTGAGSVTAVDEDDNITGYALSGGADQALFDITGAGTLEFRNAPDYESPADSDQDNTYETTVLVTSGSGNRALTSEQSIRVTVTDTDEPPETPVAPTLEPATTALAVSWLEPGGTGPPIDDYDVQYRAAGETAWADQAHTGPGRTTTVTGLTSDTTYEVRVRATNAEGTSGWSPPATAVTATNAPPVFTSPASMEVGENTTGAGTVSARDSDSGDGVIAYDISGGDDEDLLSIDRTTGLLTFDTAPDYEAPADHDRNNTYEVVVTATSGTGARELTASQAITVTVTDDTGETGAGVPDPPSLTVTGGTETSLTLGWQQPSGPPVGDYDVQYRATGGGRWSDWSHTGSARTATITGLDAGTAYEVRVRATNAEGTGEWSKPVIGTTRGNRAPQFTSPSTLTIPEPTQQVAEVRAVDSDPEDTVNSYGIAGGADRALLTIDGAGNLAFIEAPDYEAPQDADANNRYQIVVAATSGTGTRLKTATQRVTIRVIDDTAEAPPNPATVNYAWDGSEIVLSWDAVADADYYNVYYDDFFASSCTVRGGSASFCEQLATNVPDTTYRHSDPDPDRNYYWVVACSNSGCSAVDSNNPATTVGTPATTPTARYEWNGSQIVLSWDAVAGADYYSVYYDDFFASSCTVRGGSASFCEQLATDITTTSYTHADPDPDDNYYWVVACNSSGCSAVDSGSPAGTVGTVPVTPTARYEWNGSEIVLSWDAVAGAGYYSVYYDDFFASSCTVRGGSASFCEQLATDITTTSYTHADPDPDDNYYWVVACNSSGCSAVDSGSPAGTVGTVPVTPTARYEWNGSEIVLSWDAVAGAGYYSVYYDDFFASSCTVRGGSASFCEQLATDITTTSYTHADPDPDDNYYWVVACNSSGCSAVDSGSPAGTVGTVPVTPTARYEWNGSEIVLSWDAVAGADYYSVYYDDFFASSCTVRGGSASFCEELATNVTATSYTHADPDPDDNYYWVVACNSSGCSAVDSENPARAPAGGESPSFVGIPSIRINAVSTDAVTLLIVPSSEGSSSGVLFEISRSKASDDNYSVIEPTAPEGSYVDTSLDPDTLYYYVARACRGDVCSVHSESAAGITEAEGAVSIPSTPSGLDGVRVDVRFAFDDARIWWDPVPGATFYEVYQGSKLDGTVFAPLSTYYDDRPRTFIFGFEPTTYSVRACNKAGCSPSTTSITIT